MARQINPKSVSDMDIMNARAQAKSGQLLMKLGKGKRRTAVTFSKSTRAYLAKMIEEMKKQLVMYEKQLPNVFQFFNYLQKEVEITKENKKQKTKTVNLSFEEIDFLKLQMRETIKGITQMKSSLKWYNFLKKAIYKTLIKQTELVIKELSNKSN